MSVIDPSPPIVLSSCFQMNLLHALRSSIARDIYAYCTCPLVLSTMLEFWIILHYTRCWDFDVVSEFVDLDLCWLLFIKVCLPWM